MIVVTVVGVWAAGAGATDRAPDARGDRAPRCAGKPATIVGTPGADRLKGTARADVIVALDGDDEIRARGGNDAVCAGAGDDVVRGQGGADRLLGEVGEDTLVGSGAADRLAGGGGEDHLIGGPKRDRLGGGGGFDSCWGGRGPDRERGCERRSRRLANRVPKARDDLAATGEAQAVTINVLGNDSDPDRKAVSVKAVEYDETIGLVTIVDGGRAVRYDPGPGRFAGVGGGQSVADTFTYVVGDARGGRSAADVTVRIDGSDDSPQAVDDARSVPENAGATPLHVRANDPDVDGGLKMITAHSQPSQGEVEITGFGADLAYTPEPGFCTSPGPIPDDTFTYTLNGGAQATVAVAIDCNHSGPDDVRFEATPALEPAFERAIADYAIDCGTQPIEIFADSPPGTTVAIDGAAPQSGALLDSVELDPGQAFEFAVDWATGADTTHSVRCLPPDFPEFAAEVPGTPQAEFYVVTPSLGTPPAGASPSYTALFDANGVPVWWLPSGGDSDPVDAKVLPNGNIAWMHRVGVGDPGMEERGLDGTLVRSLDTAGSGADHHDLQLLPNGNYLIGRYFEVPDQDMTACGGPASGTLVDNEIQELEPDGDVAWSWRASEHIPLAEVTDAWESRCSGNGDIYHWNSIEIDGDGYVLSFRHLDAVYRIDGDTGAIDWKLGGEPRVESLTVEDDPFDPQDTLSAQHDARVRADGTLTVHDNGTGLGRAPRAVRYEIDAGAGTATWLEQVSDPQAPGSPCCGSTRKLPGEEGNWVSSWGGNPYFTEQTPFGLPVLRVTFAGELHSYRAHPVMPGELDREALRAGMNAQHPRD